MDTQNSERCKPKFRKKLTWKKEKSMDIYKIVKDANLNTERNLPGE